MVSHFSVDGHMRARMVEADLRLVDETAIAAVVDEVVAIGLGIQVDDETAVIGGEGSWMRQTDLIVLDVMLPDFDGYEICRQIRDKSMVPIIFLSAKSDESDKLISYAMGGDEYITKPFSPKMLLAKISAMLKRQSYYDDKGANDNRYSFGSFVLDFEKKLLFKDGKEVILTAKEYSLLEYLIINRNITLSKDKLLSSVWNMDYQGYDNTVMVHIHNLREKIEEDPSDPRFIRTVKGRGYIFAG